ncbi:MAG: PTS transporter subunit EIIB, partial [Fusobacteriaceae bacterium]
KSKHDEVALVIFEALGGKENIVSVDYCATRLRLEVKNSSIIDDKKIKSVSSGVLKPTSTSVQVIVGTTVEFVATEFKKLM